MAAAAAAGEKDVEYESDQEESKQLLTMRRRQVASDDEDSEGGGAIRTNPNNVDSIHSDESDGRGAAEDYDEEDEYDDEEIYDELINEREANGQIVRHVEINNVSDKKIIASDVPEGVDATENPVEGEEKPESDPFVVPTAGAFYMHDDRFRDNAVGRQRLTFDGRKLWQSKDDRKWGHDKFEEMTIQERRPDERRRPLRGRGRGRNHTVEHRDHGYGRGNRSRTFDENTDDTRTNHSNQSQTTRPSFRGRGPKRYESSFRKSNQAFPRQNKQLTNPLENTLRNTSGQSLATSSNMESDSVSRRKHTIGSSLNSASPPFYPSSSANKDIGASQKKGVESGNATRNNRGPAWDNHFVPQSNAFARGKNIPNSKVMEKLSLDDHVTSFAPSGSSSVHSSKPQISRTSQFNKRGPPPIRVQQASAQALGQRSGDGSKNSYPPRTSPSLNSYEVEESHFPSESSKNKVVLTGKGKGGVQGSGRGSFVYGDEKFTAPAFLPVIQFSGQHPGGMGVPTMGMAFPGYVSQTQHGLGNSELTWLPVLTGAAGALGASYCPPYIAVDGAYHAPPSPQTTTSGTSSKASNTSTPNSERKPSQVTEAANEEHGKRPNKPRRYSEMNFGQRS